VPELVRPSEQYRESYIAAVRKIKAEGWWSGLDLERMECDFGAYVREMLGRSDRATQEPELVCETFYWLVEGDEWLGVTSVRHELTEQLSRVGGHIGYVINPAYRREGFGKLILELVLPKARELGLRRVLVTCDSTNIGSQKIIEANGGILEDEIQVEGELVGKRRYWIDLSNANGVQP
jgi:predicted acetyltransferase